ncbi:hypothetical protein FDECE_15929 [Fusarium decemcellulare]|nr:hypothetical protein FDECE_15929 [Fusarium decemcellulare]
MDAIGAQKPAMSATLGLIDTNPIPPYSPAIGSSTSIIKVRPPKPPKPQSIMVNKLCDRCSALDLSVKKFLFGDDQSSDARPSIRSLRLANERYILGTLAQITERATSCQLCALISRALPDTPSTSTEGALCRLIWEIDGRTWTVGRSIGQESEAVKRTRRLRVCWDHPCLRQCESYLVLAAPSAYDNSDVGYRDLLNGDTEFLGRRLGRLENKKNLIQELLRLCERCHHDRCITKLGIEDDFHETLKEPYFGVIDIENDSLVPLPFRENGDLLTFESYAAVSYVWGSHAGRQHTTRIANIQSRRKSGGLAQVIRELPKALQQAIRLVHALGIRYIWIDALCIVQDSSHSWNLNARAMHLIYGNAIFTLCAADGPDAHTGLVALDESHRPEQWIANCADGLTLLLHQPPEVSIEASQWNKRAWTFQERLLSRRCLIFTAGRVYFQCRSATMSEDIFTDRDGRGWSLDLLRSPLQMLSQLKLRALWFYTRCVSLYTQRELSEPFDILSAFSGMCKLMEYTMHAPFSFGLPTSHFDFALLWQPNGRASRLLKPKRSDEPKYSGMKFPSWSWCGWQSDGISYSPDVMDSCFPDIRAWLLNRTWIDWHIRDGHGTLRRVWDGFLAEEDESTSPRWKGYEPRYETDPSDASSVEAGPPSPVLYMPSPEPSHLTPQLTTQQGPIVTPAYRDMTNTISTPGTPKKVRWQPDTAGPNPRNHDGEPEDERDIYGRLITAGAMSATIGLHKDDFTLTLPEDPYHVRKTTAYQKSTSFREFPDQIFLQFFTWKTSFHIVPVMDDTVDSSDSGHIVGAGLRRCHIMDRCGDKCGSIVIDTEWLRQKGLLNDDMDDTTQSTEFEFIAISEAKMFTKDEFPDWIYYIAKERVESEWDLFFVLLIEYFPVEGFYRRVALGKVFKAAFSLAEDSWKEIILG